VEERVACGYATMECRFRVASSQRLPLCRGKDTRTHVPNGVQGSPKNMRRVCRFFLFLAAPRRAPSKIRLDPSSLSLKPKLQEVGLKALTPRTARPTNMSPVIYYGNGKATPPAAPSTCALCAPLSHVGTHPARGCSACRARLDPYKYLSHHSPHPSWQKCGSTRRTGGVVYWWVPCAAPPRCTCTRRWSSGWLWAWPRAGCGRCARNPLLPLHLFFGTRNIKRSIFFL